MMTCITNLLSDDSLSSRDDVATAHSGCAHRINQGSISATKPSTGFYRSRAILPGLVRLSENDWFRFGETAVTFWCAISLFFPSSHLLSPALSSLLFLASYDRRNADLGSQRRLFSPVPTTIRPFILPLTALQSPLWEPCIAYRKYEDCEVTDRLKKCARKQCKVSPRCARVGVCMLDASTTPAAWTGEPVAWVGCCG